MRNRPLLIYDGDCGFCSASVQRLHRITGDRVEYVPSSEAAAEFPEVSAGDWAGSVQFIDRDGSRTARASAVFRTLATSLSIGRLLQWAYERVPGFGLICDGVYDCVARNRARLSRLIGRTACGLDRRA